MHPILLTAFGTPIHAYAVATVVSYAAAVVIGIVLGLRDGRSLRDLIELGVVIVLAAVLGAKVFHTMFEAAGHKLPDGRIAQNVGDLLAADPWHWARLSDPGYVFYGGVVFGIAFAYFFTLRRELLDKGAFGDYAVPGFAAGLAVGRLGCFLAGCCYGRATSLPWGVVFPTDHPTHGARVHPVQLYEMGFALAWVVLSLVLWDKRRFSGEAFAAFIASYAVWRFFVEFLRDDSDRGMWLAGLLSTSQVVSLVVLPATLFFWWRALRLLREGKLRVPGTPLASSPS